MKEEEKNLWEEMVVLLFISSVFGFMAFLVGRAAFGSMIGRKRGE